MTLRIERKSRDGITVLKLIGQIRSGDLEELRAQLNGGNVRVLDLDELTLVDAAVVRFLGAYEGSGVELLNCAPYIREWIRREKESQ
jgi:anti-anti-sigma regulatory factor